MTAQISPSSHRTLQYDLPRHLVARYVVVGGQGSTDQHSVENRPEWFVTNRDCQINPSAAQPLYTYLHDEIGFTQSGRNHVAQLTNPGNAIDNDLIRLRDSGVSYKLPYRDILRNDQGRFK